MARQMKDSGIEWIGEIPETWEIRKHKTLFDCSKEIVGEASAITQLLSLTTHGIRKKGQEVSAGKVPESFDTYQTVAPDDIVMCLFDLDCSAVFSGISPYQGMISPAYKVLKCKGEIIPLFADYWFKFVFDGRKYRTYAKNLRYTLTYDEFAMLSLALPSLVEQGRIAAFLDRKCAEIDAVIERTKVTIEEYKKLKQAVITEAVTKGVCGPRPMKDSGIEWIGEIPEGWTTAILKYSIRWKSEKGQPDATVLSLYRDYGVVPKDSRDDNHNVTSLDTSTYKVVSVGDFVINKMKAWQGSMAVSDYAGIVSPAYHVCEITNPTLNKRYLHHLLRNHLYIPEYTRLSTGMRIGQWDLGFDDFKNLPFIIPPIDEQAEIVEYIENGLSQYDTLIAKKTALLTELETYKKSLIYEYVTGKKECLEGIAHVAAANEYPYFPATVNARNSRFAQAVLMSKILDIHGKGIGRVKLEKMLYTIETSIGFDFDTEYVREIAGPLHESVYKCEGIISRKNKWYQLHKSQYGVSYIPTKNVEGYRSYYDRYFSAYNAEVERIINIFKPYSTDQAEVVATLFAAWNDAIIEGKPFTDESIVDDVLNNWHDKKKRFAKEVWLRAMAQMKQNNIVPKGYGKRTVLKKECNS
ncbi:MAG: hypothetical protein E7331_10995 [Clostridiales bacterium]|nr:hypothetical protein [Clostridiales bacterium]